LKNSLKKAPNLCYTIRIYKTTAMKRSKIIGNFYRALYRKLAVMQAKKAKSEIHF